jgi:DNA-directed RNA polymerase
VEANIDKIRESATNPLDGSRWWAKADEPFQALAVCMELVDAINSGNPFEFESNIPVHQDGSCNGLQHYAALGRDAVGGAAVNLLPADVPQDVYSKVLEIVIRKIKEDSLIPLDAENGKKGIIARRLDGVIDRKVIKQTVMTSVYGVTRIGARMQIQNRLHEKFYDSVTTVINNEMENELFYAAR